MEQEEYVRIQNAAIWNSILWSTSHEKHKKDEEEAQEALQMI